MHRFHAHSKAMAATTHDPTPASLPKEDVKPKMDVADDNDEEDEEVCVCVCAVVPGSV